MTGTGNQLPVNHNITANFIFNILKGVTVKLITKVEDTTALLGSTFCRNGQERKENVQGVCEDTCIP